MINVPGKPHGKGKSKKTRAQPKKKRKENPELVLPASAKGETDFIIEPPWSNSVTSASQAQTLRPLVTLRCRSNGYSHVHHFLPAMRTWKHRVAQLLHKEAEPRTSLVVQWLRHHLPMQGTQVRSLVQELRPHMLQSNHAQAPQTTEALHLEPVLHKESRPRSPKLQKIHVQLWRPSGGREGGRKEGRKERREEGRKERRKEGKKKAEPRNSKRKIHA